MRLTEEQHAAVSHDGDLVLTACPGSGKTRTIIAKLIREIERLHDTPRAVACITYTNSAVQEIEERVAAHLKPGDELNFSARARARESGPWYQLFHSFCLNCVYRPFAWRLPGFRGTVKILTPDSHAFVEIAQYAANQIRYYNLDSRDLDGSALLRDGADGRQRRHDPLINRSAV